MLNTAMQRLAFLELQCEGPLEALVHLGARWNPLLGTQPRITNCLIEHLHKRAVCGRPSETADLAGSPYEHLDYCFLTACTVRVNTELSRDGPAAELQGAD